MARGKIRGITIEIGGDTSKLEKSLSNVNKDIKSTSSQLKDVERLLKLDPTNVQLLEQKQRLLNKSVDDYKSKLTTLKAEQERFAKAAKEGVDGAQESYDALTREIIETETNLKKASKEADNFSVTTAKMSAGLDKLSNKAQSVADSTRALSAAGAVVAGSIVAMGLKSAQAADDLNTLAQQSGFATDELQKFDYAADRVDVSSDAIISAARKLKKNMTSTSSDVTEAWRKLGVNVTDSQGQLRDSTEVFYDVLGALSRVGNETERDALAMQIFGRNADELAGIIDDGGEALRNYGEEAEKAGLIWSQESINAANAVQDTIDKLKADLSQTVLITGAKALEALMPVIEKVIGAISKLLEWFSQLDAGTIEIILGIAAVIAAISPLFGVLAQLGLAINGILALIPIITAVAPFAVAAAAIITIIVSLIAWWDDYKAAFLKVVNAIKQAWQSFKDMLQNTADAIKQKWDNFKQFFVNMWDVLKERATTNINSIIDAINKVIEKVNSFIQTINGLGISQKLGINIGSIPTLNRIGEQAISSPSYMPAPSTYNTSNTTNVYNQTANRPIQVNVEMDSRVVARGLYEPMNELMNTKGVGAVAK